MKALIESLNGHEEVKVPQEQAQGFIEKQLKEDKWVSTENKEGETELHTKSDIPKDDDIEKQKEWADKFTDTKTAIVTNKGKGG